MLPLIMAGEEGREAHEAKRLRDSSPLAAFLNSKSVQWSPFISYADVQAAIRGAEDQFYKAVRQTLESANCFRDISEGTLLVGLRDIFPLKEGATVKHMGERGEALAGFRGFELGKSYQLITPPVMYIGTGNVTFYVNKDSDSRLCSFTMFSSAR